MKSQADRSERWSVRGQRGEAPGAPSLRAAAYFYDTQHQTTARHTHTCMVKPSRRPFWLGK